MGAERSRLRRREVERVGTLVGGYLAILVFFLSCLPGLFVIFLWFWNIRLANPLLEFQAFVLDDLLLSLRSLPSDVVALIAVALPVLAHRACYTDANARRFTNVGLICFSIAAAAAGLNILALLSIDSLGRSFIVNIGTESQLQSLRGWVEKGAYFGVMYALVLLRLRPQEGGAP